MSTMNQLGKYQPYPDYKDSGVEWLGEVPAHWCSTTIKYGFSVCLGKMLQKDAKNEAEKLKPYLKAQNIQPNGVNISVVEQMWFSLSEIRTLRLEKGDVLVSEGGDVGRSAIWNDELPECYIQNAINRVRPVKGNSSRFFLYWMSFLKGSSYIDVICNKATIAHYTAEKVEVSPLLLPDDNEQRTIAAFLDYETARIDQLIAKQQQLIELLKEKRQAVISHAVTKGLNPNAPMKDTGVEWLGQVPEHWVVAGFKKFLGKIIDYRGKTPEKTDSGVFLVTARNIKNGVIDYSLSQEFVSESDYEEIMRRGKPSIGDVLFTTEAPLGEVAQVDRTDIALAQRIIKFCGIANILSNDYLKLYMQSTSFQQGLQTYATGSTALGIKADRLGYLRQLLPPIVEQSEIVEYVKCEQARYSKLISVAEKAISIMQERRTALISAAVTGKIDLRGWQPPKSEEAA